MAIRPILKHGHPVLKKKAIRVENVDEGIKNLASDMLETMYAAPGIGLAAPQVGESVRLIVVDVKREEVDDPDARAPMVLINPEILKEEGLCSEEEGCLSFPGIRALVKRPESITVRALNEHGESVELTDIGGILARCIQHEIDHLDGVVFVDKISKTDRLFLSGKLKKLAKENKPRSS